MNVHTRSVGGSLAYNLTRKFKKAEFFCAY